jgi:hypothetical protein
MLVKENNIKVLCLNYTLGSSLSKYILKIAFAIVVSKEKLVLVYVGQ